MAATTICHCGRPLHYNSQQVKAMVEAMVARQGEFVLVGVLDSPRKFRVSRHYIALHGLKGTDVERLGFEEVFVEERSGGYYVVSSRVSLDSVVYAYLRGESPKGILESFPALNLAQVEGALKYYLANRDTVDEYLRKGKQEFDRQRDEGNAHLR